MDRLDLIDFGVRPASDIEMMDLVADVTRQRTDLAFRPSVPMSDGIARTLAWYRSGGRFRG